MSTLLARARLVAGIAVLAVGAWALVAVLRPTEAPSPARAFTSSEQCKECHPNVYAEWSESWHARAWNDPEVRALSNEFQNTDCIDCHAPRPVFETGIGERVLPRTTRRAEGVDCIACHILPEPQVAPDERTGSNSTALVAGTIDKASAACRPRSVRDLASADFCAVCHDQHKTVQQWKASEYAARGIGCVDCHMPPRNGDPNAGRTHTMHGGHDLDLVKRAVALRGAREEGVWVVDVENVGAGHDFPTDERARAADVFWRPLGDAGASATPWRHLYRFRSPYRHEVDLPDTLLPAHEKKRLTIDDAAARGRIEVALFYKTKPYWLDPAHPDPEREAELVHRIVLEP